MPEAVYGEIMRVGARTAKQAEAARIAEEEASDPIEQIKRRKVTAGDLLDGGAAIKAEISAVEQGRRDAEKARKAEVAELKDRLPSLSLQWTAAMQRKLNAAAEFNAAAAEERTTRDRYERAARRARALAIHFHPTSALDAQFAGTDREVRRIINDFNSNARGGW